MHITVKINVHVLSTGQKPIHNMHPKDFSKIYGTLVLFSLENYFLENILNFSYCYISFY